MNESKADQLIKKAYQSVRIVKEIQRGSRSALAIATKTNAPLNLVHYYLRALEVEV